MIRRQMVSAECDAHVRLGEVLRQQGRYGEAIAEITLGLDRVHEVGDSRTESDLMNTLAQVIRESGDPAAAEVVFRRALGRARTVPHWYEQARAHLGIGDCLSSTDPVAAGEHWQEACRIFTELQVPDRAEAERRMAGQVAVGRR
jgi:hypothetical protein